MGLEAASYISQLDSANPGGSDAYSTADDHLRLIKAVLKTQFPNLGAAAVTPTAAELNVLLGNTNPVERTNNKNAASGYMGLDASSRAAKANQHTQTAYKDEDTTFSVALRIAAADPILWLQETDAAADNKLWVYRANSAQLLFQVFNDAVNVGSTWLTVNRTGTTIGNIDFAGTALRLNTIPVMLTTTAVTNTQVPVGAVTQHQASLSIAFSQLTGSIANGQVPVGAVTQHQGSLSIAFSQLTGSIANGQVPSGAVTQHQASLSIAWGQLTGVPGSFTPAAHTQTFSTITGSIADAQVPQSAVTQHQGALTTRNISGKTGTAKTLAAGSGPPSLTGATDGDMWYYY